MLHWTLEQSPFPPESHAPPHTAQVMVLALLQDFGRLAQEKDQRQLIDGCIRDIAAKLSKSIEQAERSTIQFLPRCPKCQRQYLRPKWSKFDPVCAGCGHELKLVCDYCHEEYTPKRWQWHQKGGRFCCQSHRARWHNVNGDDSWKKERQCECGCRHSFTPEKRTHIFYSDDCQYRHYRKLHAKELDAAATVYYQAHKKEIAARTQKHREDPEVRERIHAQGRAWRASNPDKVKEKNARFNAARVAKLAETERLKNLEGLDLKTGLRISLTAHRWLEGAKSLYDMKDDVYPDSVDAFNAIKQLDRRFHAVIEDEQQRIAKLSDEQRRADADCRRIRLSQELNKPKK